MQLRTKHSGVTTRYGFTGFPCFVKKGESDEGEVRLGRKERRKEV